MISNGSIKPAKIFFILTKFKILKTHSKTCIKVINNIENTKCLKLSVAKLPKIFNKKVKIR
jgi:hypothetical protein